MFSSLRLLSFAFLILLLQFVRPLLWLRTRSLRSLEVAKLDILYVLVRIFVLRLLFLLALLVLFNKTRHLDHSEWVVVETGIA